LQKRRVEDLPPPISVVVPCFNESDAIRSIVSGLETVVREIGGEIVVVDDGSTDGTTEILDKIASDGSADDSIVRVIHHRRNLGYGAAIKSGVRRARYQWIVITDADGTYPNDRIGDLVSEAANADMVVGARTQGDGGQPLLRRMAKAVLRAHCSWLVGEPIPDMNSGLRIFRKSVFEKFAKILPDGFSLTTTITVAMMRSRYRVVFLPIRYSERVGRSKIRPLRDTLGFLQLIARTGMYFAPLRVLLPLATLLMLGFVGSVSYDLFVLHNLTDKTILLFLFTVNTVLFGMLADMIDKRS
jgi:glycosyltransferase involved in cell wall biosynthesis